MTDKYNSPTININTSWIHCP